MMLRTRTLGAIGLVLIALTIWLGLVADPLVRRALREHRELAQRIAAIDAASVSGATLPPPPELASESAAATKLWIAVGISGAVALLLCAIALRALLAPIDALRDACKRAPEWGATPPLDERRGDELGQLCAAFDRMRARLEQWRRRSALHHEQLETSVASKTRQLAASVERLRTLDQMKDAFLASASRELLDPVRSVLAACDELDRPASVEPRAEVLRRVLADCRRLDQKTRAILDFVRTNAEGFEFRLETTNVLAVLQRALAAVRARITRSDVAIEVVHLGDCTVVWDGNWIARVIESIVENAVQRAPAGSTVVVEQRLQGPDVRVEVRFDRLAQEPAAGVAPDRMDRTIWAPVIDRHLGEWSERESDAQASIVLVLPALAEHLSWIKPAEPVVPAAEPRT